MAPDPNSPIRHFRADSPFNKSESAWVAQTYGRLQNYTKLRRAFRRKSCNQRNQTGQRKSWQIEIGNFCAKQTNLAETGHTRRRAELCLCVAALQADSLSTCCEWQKRDRTNLSLYKKKQVSSPCHVSATHSMCSKNPPAVPRHTTLPGAVCGRYEQNLSALRKKLFRFAKNSFGLFVQQICGEMPSSTSYNSVADHMFAQPKPIHS